uniref:Uncharacterized protein n=1 Tax=Zea mays TaxID=4577 RepID=A0A804NQF6_MAIZE
MARMRALEGQQLLGDDPTVVYLNAYLLTLDAQYDFLARHHRQMIARAEDAEKRNRYGKARAPQILPRSPPELFEPLTMKKIPTPSLEVKEEATSTPPAPPPSKELQEPVPLEEEFDPVLPSQSPLEDVINISSLLTHPGDVSD